MKKMRWFVAVLALASCEPVQLGSRYLTSKYVDAAGGTVTVSASEELRFAGVSLEIPAGAVSKRTLFTVEPALADVVAKDESASTGVRWGPDDVEFAIPATVRIPVESDSGSLAEGFEAVVESSYDVSAYDVAFDAKTRFVSFKVSHLGSVQIRRRPQLCGPNHPCPPSMVCVRPPWQKVGICRSASDGGVQSCSSSADCGSAEECVNGVCQPRGYDGGACEPRVDGGITCNSGADCPVDLPYCLNCQCHSFCPMCETCDHRDGGYDAPRFDAGIICPPYEPDGGSCIPDIDGGVCPPQFDGGSEPPTFDGGVCAPNPDAGLLCATAADCPLGLPYCLNCQCLELCPPYQTCDFRDGGSFPSDGGGCPPPSDGGFFDGGC